MPSKQNPADIASRGQSNNELKSSSLWWHGPSFLLSNENETPNQHYKLPIDTAPEKKKSIKVFHVSESNQNCILSKFESYNRLLHFTCLTLRWINRARAKTTTKSVPIERGPITAIEMQNAENHWIRQIQQRHFGNEIGRMKAKRNLPHNSMLLRLQR